MTSPNRGKGGVLGRYTAALAFPDYRNMWLANLSAQTAAWALIVARGWFVFHLNESSTDVALVTFAALLPAFVVPPIAGVYADRLDRRKLLGWSYVVNMAANLVLGVLGLMGALSLWIVVALSLVNGAARFTQMPVSQALAANLVPRDTLLNALSLNQATNQFSRLAGAVLVTPILALLGAPLAFFICTALYALGWYQTLRIKTVSVGGVKAGQSFWANLAAGFTYIRSQPLILMVTVLVCFHCSLTMAFESTLPGFSSTRLGDPNGFGVLMTAVGVGSLFGSIYVGGIAGAVARGRMLLAMGLLSGAGQVLLGFSTDMATAWVAAAVMGASQSGFMTLGQAITQTVADDQFRGRIASINTLSFQGLMAMMNLSNGVMADMFGSQYVLFFTGSLFVLVMLGSLLVFTPRRVYLDGVPDHTLAARPAA